MPDRTLTRGEFLKVAGAGMAGGALLGASGLAGGCTLGPDDGFNVVLVIVDSLRRDHVVAYGNPWIKTPNLDALAKESLRFSRPYPESIPTLCARRPIHTGTRTWPFKNWHPAKGDDIILWGWQPIPNYQTTLSEVLRRNGYGTYFVTDNLQQYKASMNFHRGFDAFDFLRGQTSDPYKPFWTHPSGKMQHALTNDEAGEEGIVRQYWTNVAGRRGEKDWFSPRVFTGASDYLEAIKDAGPYLHGGGQLRSARTLGFPREVRLPLRRRLSWQGALLAQLRPERLPRRAGAAEVEGPLLRGGHHG